MKPERRWVATDRMARIALRSLATIALAFCVPCRADDAAAGDPAVAAGVAAAAPVPDATSTLPASEAATPLVTHHRSAKHLTVAQSIDESVRRMTRGLDLDSGQQENLHQILVDQHRRIMKLRSANSAALADITGTTLTIYDQTKARIRTMLNDEQRAKYPADVPRNDLAPAQADMTHWMDLQESKRRQDQTEGKAK